jgi:spermidine synthase
MLHLSFISSLMKTCRSVFPTVNYAYTSVPTYPSGQIGFMVCCKHDPATTPRDMTKPLRSWDEETERKLCRYYNRKVHEASFVLPTFARETLK